MGEVGAIEDYVFGMKHKNEENERPRRQYHNKNRASGNKLPISALNAPQEVFQRKGRAGRLISDKEADTTSKGKASDIKLQRGYAAKEELRNKLKGKTSTEDNTKAADALKQQLLSNCSTVEAIEGNKQKETAAAKKRVLQNSNSDMKDADDMFGDSDTDSKGNTGDMEGVLEADEKDEAATEEA